MPCVARNAAMWISSGIRVSVPWTRRPNNQVSRVRWTADQVQKSVSIMERRKKSPPGRDGGAERKASVAIDRNLLPGRIAKTSAAQTATATENEAQTAEELYHARRITLPVVQYDRYPSIAY